MRPVLKLLKRVVAFGGWLAGLLLVATTALIASEIVLRTFFGRSTQVAEEYSGYFLAAMIYLGAAYTLQKGEHIRVEILRERLGERAGLWLERFVLLVGLCFATLLVYAFGKQFLTSVTYASRSFMPSRTPLAVPHGAVALGAALLWLQFFVMVAESWLPGAKRAPLTQSL